MEPSSNSVWRYRAALEGDGAGKVEGSRLPQESTGSSFQSSNEIRHSRSIPKCAAAPPSQLRMNANVARTFSDLEILDLSDCTFSLETFDLDLSFTKLQRLVLSFRPALLDGTEDDGRLSSPVHMPNLIHLALESPVFSSRISFDPTSLFGSLVPRVTTLALSDSILDYSASDLFETIGRCSKLKHLSLSIEYDDLESLLFTNAAGMHLASLHISSSTFDDLTDLLPRLTVVAKGEPETIRVERVVLYEEEERLPGRKVQMADSDGFEWRGDRGKPPFEDFDGR